MNAGSAPGQCAKPVVRKPVLVWKEPERAEAAE